MNSKGGPGGKRRAPGALAGAARNVKPVGKRARREPLPEVIELSSDDDEGGDIYDASLALARARAHARAHAASRGHTFLPCAGKIRSRAPNPLLRVRACVRVCVWRSTTS